MKVRVGLLSLLCCASLSAQDKDKLRQQYEEKRMQAPLNAKGQFDLGRWCDGKGLKEEAVKAYEKALEIDPEYEPARRVLGHKKVLGRWTSDKNYEDSTWWAHPKVPQKPVDEAVIKAVSYLLSQVGKFPESRHPHSKFRYDELVLLTVIESGWDRRDPRVQQLINRVIGLPLDHTYHVSLRAMCLASLDPLKYQQLLAQCAQFLVDNQCANGQWSYGKPVPSLPQPGQYPTTDKGPIPDISTGLAADPSAGKGAAQPKQIEIKKGQSVGPATGDNSNSQYAALGIRACLSGLVVVPKDTIKAAEAWFERCQKSDGGWGYTDNAQEPAWGSMTGGAVGTLAIYKYYLSRIYGESADWRSAPSIGKGIAWLGSKTNYGSNPLFPNGNFWHHYWIYAVERAGRLLETEQFGSFEWYPQGVSWLLSKQQADGSWQRESWGNAMQNNFRDQILPGVITETCFAVLFLRRATPRLDDTLPKIKSGDARGAIPAGDK
jgi:hypothetical protein